MPWINLPVGKSIPRSGENTDTITIQIEPPKSSKKQKAMFRFKFKKSDSDDVNYLINIINVLDYMHDEDSRKRLEPYQDYTAWKDIADKHDILWGPGHQLIPQMKILQLVCGYKYKRMYTTNVEDLLSNKHPVYVGGDTNMLEGIIIFESMIFDSKNDETLPATKENIDKYILHSNHVGNSVKVEYCTFWLDKNAKPKKSKSMFPFKFKQSDSDDPDDVCLLINVINVLDYMLYA